MIAQPLLLNATNYCTLLTLKVIITTKTVMKNKRKTNDNNNKNKKK